MNYYVMECEGVPPVNSIGTRPRLPGGPWMTGKAISIPLNVPLKFAFDPEFPGNLKIMYDDAIPLMRNDLANVLVKAGVDNIEFFEAIVEDPLANVTYTDYRAFNILGLVDAADMSLSQFMDEDIEGDELIDVNFDSLVIDPTKIPKELLMFRLAQCVSAIVVHDVVRIAVESAHLAGVKFYANGEWAG